MAVSYAALNECAEALACYHKALRITRVALCPNLSDVGTADSRQGDEFLAFGQLPEALASYVRSLDLRRQTYGDASLNAAVSHSEIGRVYADQERYMQSMESYGKALQIFQAFSR
jgi:tetratricopeptide (TPR) repeat protein